jgi:hypothetical protein
MKCPHCQARIGLFSDEMKTLGRARTCPRCGGGVEMAILPGRFTLAFVPVAVAAIVLGVSGPLSAGVAGGLGAVFGFGLRRRD